RMVSDCIAVSEELAIGIDVNGNVFGVGWDRNGNDINHSLTNKFDLGIHALPIRIQLALAWLEGEKSLTGSNYFESMFPSTGQGKETTTMMMENDEFEATTLLSRLILQTWNTTTSIESVLNRD